MPEGWAFNLAAKRFEEREALMADAKPLDDGYRSDHPGFSFGEPRDLNMVITELKHGGLVGCSCCDIQAKYKKSEEYARIVEATIAADRKRIEELEINDKKNRVSIADLIAEKLQQATTIERLEKELGFKYGKQCHCGYTVWIIPNECKDGSL